MTARKRRALGALGAAPLNFDRRRDRHPHGDGWNVDDRRQPLPAEEPGPPAPGGSWEIAGRLMHGYEFADPSIVRAFYDRDKPLEGRDLLLQLRFWGLRFLVGVRVVEVFDDTRHVDGREARVWGWSYATLEGHLEMGEMSWEVRKWLDSGEVEFAVHAYSKAAEIGNPLVRLGFRLVGRREQLRFLRMTCVRMRRLTEEALRDGPRAEAVGRAAGEVTARPLLRSSAAPEQVARDVEPEADRD